MLTRFCISSHPAAAWAEVVGPWLREHGAAWQAKRVVLAPNAAWLAALKAGAVAEGLPILGIEWLTPGHLRTRALAALPGPKRPIALREDLHLLLELAAAQLPDNPLARAYGVDPAPFQELLDTLESAGWDAAVLPDAHARELARMAEKLRTQAGWLTSAAADKTLREAVAAGQSPVLGQHIIMVGFGLSDWPQVALLEVAAAAFTQAELVCDAAEGTVERDSTSAAWIGRWEEISGLAAEWLDAPAAMSRPFGALADAVRAQNFSSVKNTAPQFWLAENLSTEADLVAAQALAFLAQGEAARVGVVVGSGGSPLAREVAARLAALGCPHHDATGHLPGRANAQALFEAWLDWQEDGRLAGLVRWVRATARHGLLGEKSAQKIEEALQEAARALLTDDPAVLAAWLPSAALESVETRDFLAAWPRLPAMAGWPDYREKFLAVSALLQWPEPPEALALRAKEMDGKIAGDVPRAALMRWLRAVTRVPGRTRAALGREPWARVQIVDAASAVAQSWTHLVLGGLNHGEWPADFRDSPLLGDSLAEKLNQESLRQGSQGKGHWTVAPGRGILPTTAGNRRLDRANFARLLGLPSEGLALSARRNDPADGRRARVSEYFWAAARAVVGHLPSEADWAALAAATTAQHQAIVQLPQWQLPAKIAATSRAAPGPEQTVRAYVARRTEQSAFDEYSFCLRASPATPLRLSCKNWEEALARPGASWLKFLLKARPRWNPAEDESTGLSIGLWAHTLARPGPENAAQSFALPNLATWQKFSADLAQKNLAAATTAFAAAGRGLPETWLEAQATAMHLAEQWIAAVAEAGWPQALSEIKLPPDLRVKLPGRADELPLSGRLDLVLFSQPVDFVARQLGGAQAWMFDFKTGADKSLTLKLLAKGAGLQLALYALALQALGAGAVRLTLLNSDAAVEAQLTEKDLADPLLAERWKLLGEFARMGRWGEFADLEDEYARPGDYPAATLPVPVEILRSKWALTHSCPP